MIDIRCSKKEKKKKEKRSPLADPVNR